MRGRKLKRVLSGVLTAVTMLSAVLQPMVVNAAEMDTTVIPFKNAKKD